MSRLKKYFSVQILISVSISVLLLFDGTRCFADENEPVSLSIPSELASPWTTPARPWLLGGIAATTFIFVFDGLIEKPLQRVMVERRPLGSASQYGDYGGQLVPNVAYVIGMLSYGLIAKDDLALERSFSMFKATLYASSVATVLKKIVREPRPNDSMNLNSFPSGHATSVFAFASYVAAEHPLPYGIAAFGLATFTGLSRINDNKHYLHDVFAGATIGTAYGLGLSYLHSKARTQNLEKNGRAESELQVIPIYSSELKGAAFVLDF